MRRNATGLLTRGSLPRRLPGSQASDVVAGERLPSQRRDRPGFAPGSLTAFLYVARAYHRTVSGSIVRLWLPVALWAALIFTLSSIPDLGSGLGGWDTVLRKLAHAGEFGILGALLMRAVGRVDVAFGLGVLYAVSDELHQSLVPGRSGTPLDVGIDAVGVAGGIVLWQWTRARSVV
jgi:VanZ like family